MRSFSTDRPTKSNVPYTVDAGHWQYEADLANYSQLTAGGQRTDMLVTPNLTLKLGVATNADLELNIVPYERSTVTTRATGEHVATAGFGDMVARLKVNLWGNDGGGSALAVIPYVKIPTAQEGLGNGATEGGLLVPLSLSLPQGFSLILNSGVAALRNTSGGGYHADFVNLANLSRPLRPDVTMFVEVWSDSGVGAPAQASADTAVAWVARRNLQFDTGVNIGLNHNTPGYQVYLGAAQRF
jgi:hypothetical protein